MNELHLHAVAAGERPGSRSGSRGPKKPAPHDGLRQARQIPQGDLLSLVASAVVGAVTETLESSDLNFTQGSRRGPASGHSRRLDIGPLGEVLLLDIVAAEAQGPLFGLRGTHGLRRSLGRIFAALGCSELSPQALPRLAERLSRTASGERVAARVAEIGRLYQRYRGLLGPQRLDAALRFAQGSRALRIFNHGHGHGQGATEITLTGLHRAPLWDGVPTPHGMLLALLSLLRPNLDDPAPRLLRVLLPAVEPERPALEQALTPILDALYERHSLNIEVDWAPLGPAVDGDAAESPWGRFVRGLFAPLGATPLVETDEISPDSLSLSPLPSPRGEARFVARAIRDLLDNGVAADAVAVIVESPARRARLVEELLRYDVPVRIAAPPHGFGTPFDSSSPASASEPLPPPLQLVLGIYELFGPEPTPVPALSREALIQLLTTRYLRWPLHGSGVEAGPAVRPWQMARALRGAGVRDLTLLAGADSAAELHRRIGEWQRQQKPGSEASESALLQHIESILGELRTLPENATIGQHVTALRRLCDRLQLRRLAGSPEAAWLGGAHSDDETADERADDDAELLAAECRALSRDQAAIDLLEQVLDELPRREQLLRLHELQLSRARFAAILRAALLRLRPPVQLGAPGLGVEVSSLQALPLRPFEQLFIVGMLDGELPAGLAEDQLLDDEERRLCNRLLDAPILPLAQHAGQRAALHFTEAIAHATALHISWPIADEEGRPLLRSPFVDTVLHAAARGEPALRGEPLVPALDEARHKSELWTRAGQAVGKATQLLPKAPAATEAALLALSSRDRRRAQRLFGRVQLEATRTAWFTAFASGRESAQPGPQNGQLSNPALIAALLPRLPGSRERPLSASALEDYARCPFRFFAYRVLQAAPIAEGGDDLDPLSRGNLYHKVLETFFGERRDAKKLPLRGDDDDRAALDRALEASLVEFAAAYRGGHPGLFQVRVRRLRAEMWALVRREAQSPIEPGVLPALLEHKFGPVAITGQGDDPFGDNVLHIGGIIDRIDIGPGRALVLDYKTGRLKRYQDYLRGELLETAFQLPLYAAAVKADPEVQRQAGGEPAVTARFYAVRQAQVTDALDEPTLIALDAATRREHATRNVGEAAHQLWHRLRGGDFRVAPRSCDGCGLEAVCRIAVPNLADRDETGDEESQKSPSSSSGNSSASTLSAE